MLTSTMDTFALALRRSAKEIWQHCFDCFSQIGLSWLCNVTTSTGISHVGQVTGLPIRGWPFRANFCRKEHFTAPKFSFGLFSRIDWPLARIRSDHPWACLVSSSTYGSSRLLTSTSSTTTSHYYCTSSLRRQWLYTPEVLEIWKLINTPPVT